MRTTIDIPEGLLRQLRAAAALNGIKLKDLVASFLEQGLAEPYTDPERMGQHRPIPVTIQTGPGSIRALTNAEIEEIFIQEDLEKLGLNRSA